MLTKLDNRHSTYDNIIWDSRKCNVLKIKRIQHNYYKILLSGPLGLFSNFWRFTTSDIEGLKNRDANAYTSKLFLNKKSEYETFTRILTNKFSGLCLGFASDFIIRGIGYRYKYCKRLSKSYLF